MNKIQRVPVAPQRGDPLWATQADLSAVADHSQVASAPMLCALNKLVLDEVVSPTARLPGANHDVNQRDWEARAGAAVVAKRNATMRADQAWLQAHPK